MTDLPPGWAEVRTDEAGQLDLGRQRSPKYHIGSNMKPYLRVANVFEDRIDSTDVKSMHFEPADFERFRLQPGQVLLNEGQSPEFLGRPALYRGQPPNVAFTNSLIRFRPIAGISPEWALLTFRHHMHSGRFKRESRITTNIAHLSANRLASVEFRVPPTAEQERIVTAIEEAFSKLEAGEALLRTTRQGLKRLRESVLAAAVTGRLVPQDPTDEPASKLLANLGVAAADQLDQPIPPVGWCWAAIQVIASPEKHSMAIGPFGSDLKVSDYRAEGVPLVFVRDIRRRDFTAPRQFVSHEKAEALLAHRVVSGDVLVTKMGEPPGDTALYRSSLPAVITADCIKITPGAAIRADFLSLAISAGETRRQVVDLASGVAQQKVTLGGFRRLPVPVPPLAEQRRIVAEVERQFSFIDACERTVDVGLARSAALRRSILKSAFEGRLVPQDPTDEPAAALLDRIQAERETDRRVPKPHRRQKLQALTPTADLTTERD